MVWLMLALCAALMLSNCIWIIKVIGMRRAVDEISLAFAERMNEDTNVGIDVNCWDPKIRRLAARMDKQLKLLRKERLKYDQGNRKLKEAVTNISHDLRTPLTAIYGYMELLGQEEASPEIRSYLRIIEGRLKVLKQLSEDLFRYSLAVTGEQYEGRKTVILNQALEESLAACYGLLKANGITPRIQITEEPVRVQLNEAALSRILENVLGNAAKYSEGDLDITLEEKGVITCSNRAPDLDEVLVGRLFDRFYTVEAGRRSTGLGLSIAKTLTEQSGGEMSAVYENGRLSLYLSFTQICDNEHDFI